MKSKRNSTNPFMRGGTEIERPDHAPTEEQIHARLRGQAREEYERLWQLIDEGAVALSDQVVREQLFDLEAVVEGWEIKVRKRARRRRQRKRGA